MRKFLFMMVMFLMAISLIACSSDGANSSNDDNSSDDIPTGKPVEGGVLTVGTVTEPDSLDPHNTGQAAANIIMGSLGASLVFQDPETKDYIPYLAESWKTSEDGKTWTFTLRDGLKFHDGSSLIAEDFVATYERAKETNFVASSNLSQLESAEAPDEKTLVLTMKEPFAPLLQYLSDPGWLQPLPSDAIANGQDFSRNPIGSGPWKFESWENGQSITLAKNPDYSWGPEYFENTGAVYPEQLQYKFIEEVQTLLAALDSGSVDVAADVPANQVEKYQNSNDYYVLERPRNGLGLFIVFNLDNPLFEDVNIRQAINYAINKEAMLKSVMNGQGEISYGPLPSSFFGYDEEVENYGYHYDPDKAAELIESAGYTKGSDGIYEKDGETLEINLMTQTNGESWMQAATVIQAMLKEVGIKVNVDAMEWGTLLDTATKHQFEMTLMGYTYNDPDVLSLFLHSGESDGGLNLGSVDDQKLDDLLERGKKAVDQEERKEVYAEIQKYVVEEAYWAPLITENQFYIVDKNIPGLELHPLLNLLFHDSWVTE